MNREVMKERLDEVLSEANKDKSVCSWVNFFVLVDLVKDIINGEYDE